MVFFKHKKEDEKDDYKNLDYITNEINILNEKLKSIHNQYDYVSNDDLIEALIYEEKGLQARYSFLLKQAREANIKVEAFIKNKGVKREGL